MLTDRVAVVGGDSRPSLSWAQPVVESTLRARGVDVISIGLAPTPTIGMAVRSLKAGGAIAITASHNPEEWNGLKFFHDKGEFLITEHHKQLESLMKKPAAIKGGLHVGTIKFRHDMTQKHLEAVCKHLQSRFAAGRKSRRLRVVLDCCNGAASHLAPLVASSFGGAPEVIFANPGRSFPHNPEPVPANIKALCREVRRCKADFGAAFDPDADRLALVDEDGHAIGEERTLVLATDAYLSMENKGRPIVTNLSTSLAMDHVAAKYGVKIIRTRIGEAHVVGAMKKAHSTIGGEGNGGVIVPAIHPGRDAATALALIMAGLQLKGKNLSAWNATIPDFVMVKAKVELGRVSVAKILKRARSVFHDAVSVDETDGLKILYSDGWVHMRLSGTEPIMRIFVEAPDNGTAQELLARAQAVLK